MKLPLSHYVKAHHVSHAALSVTAVVAALVFFTLGAAIRLLIGPVSLGPFAGTLAAAVRSAVPGIDLKYDEAAIEWSRDEGRVSLVILGTRILDRNGRVVAAAPKADIDLAAAPFLKGQFVVKRITLVGVKLALVHMKEGGLRLGTEEEKGNDVLARINDLIEAKGSTTSSLESFAVRNAHVDLFDETTGVYLTAERASLALSARNDKLGASFDADIDLAGRKAHAKADFILPPSQGPVQGTVSLSHLDLRGLGAHAPMFRALRNVALEVDLAARFTLAPGGHLTEADFDLSGNGEVPFAGLPGKALHVNELHLSGNYDGARNQLVLRDADLFAREANLRFRGGGALHYDPQNRLQSIGLQLTSTRIALDMPGFLPRPVGLETASLKGAWQVGPRRFDIEKLAVVAPDLDLAIKGAVTLGEDGQSPGLEIEGALKPLPVRSLLRYWPLTTAPGTRAWIDANIFAGTIGPVNFVTHLAPGMLDQPVLPDSAVTLSFAMNGIEGNYVTGLTHLTNVTGTATLLGDSFSADFSGGRVGNILVKSGHAVIPAVHVHGTAGVFTAEAEGGMTDIMHLIDMKPLGYPTRFHIDPNQTKGQAEVQMSFTVPMLANLPVDDVGISVKAEVSGFAVTLGKSTRLTNGTVVFEIDNDHLHQTGTVNLADSRLTVDWMEDFKTADPVTTRLNVKGSLTDAGRAALDVGLVNILTGPVSVDADIRGHRGSLRSADVSLDLTPSSIAIPILNLGKPAGAAAAGHLTVNFSPDGAVHDETIRLTGPNLAANGTAQFAGDGGLTLLNFPSIKMGPLNDLSMTLQRTASGDDYTLRGRSLDGSMIGRNGSGSGGAGGNGARDAELRGPFHVSARLDRLALRDDVAIAPFNLDLSGIGSRPGTLSLSGNLSKTAAINAGIEATAAGRKLTLTAGDAGLLLRGLFAFDGMRGGTLSLTALLPGRAADPDVSGSVPDFTGKLDIDNFTLVHQAFLTRLFSAGSLTGLLDLMGGDGISIERLDVPFTSKNNVIAVRDAVAHGRAIGATADGYIDRPKSLVDLKGSLIPAYGLNSVLGNIPLLGDVLTSKKGEGIFGVTYSATGNADQPRIDVNPVSMIAPGILRRIFEGRMPNAANAPSNAPSNAPAAPPNTQSNATPAKPAQ